MTIKQQLEIIFAYKEGKQIYRKHKFSSDVESEKVPLYTGESAHDFDFHDYTYSLKEITWKDLSQEEAFKYRLFYECSTYRDFKGYVTSESALKLFNAGVEYGKYQALKENKE